MSRPNIVESRVPYHLIFTLDISRYILYLLSHSQSMKPISARSEHIYSDGLLLTISKKTAVALIFRAYLTWLHLHFTETSVSNLNRQLSFLTCVSPRNVSSNTLRFWGHRQWIRFDDTHVETVSESATREDNFPETNSSLQNESVLLSGPKRADHSVSEQLFNHTVLQLSPARPFEPLLR
jgi:hypothetical protein